MTGGTQDRCLGDLLMQEEAAAVSGPGGVDSGRDGGVGAVEGHLWPPVMAGDRHSPASK
jgi:hypothetical protein